MSRVTALVCACLVTGCNLFSSTEGPGAASVDVGRDLGSQDVGHADAGRDLGVVDLGPMLDLATDMSDAGLSVDSGRDMALDLGPRVAGLHPGQQVLIDFGHNGRRVTDAGWNNMAQTSGLQLDLIDSDGAMTPVDIVITTNFSGINDSGRTDNALGWPGDATVDSVWCGSTGTREEALLRPAQFQFANLEAGAEYDLRIFGSRAGADGSFDRLGRYTVGDVSVELDATDNVDQVVEFVAMADATGTVTVDVEVSPDGSGRFAYVSVVELTGR